MSSSNNRLTPRKGKKKVKKRRVSWKIRYGSNVATHGLSGLNCTTDKKSS